MGWTSYSGQYAPKNKAEEKATIMRVLTWNSPNGSGECVAASKVGNVWYCAVKAKSDIKGYAEPYVVANDGSITFAAVILTDRAGGEWSYKNLTEACGPVDAKCPKTVLAKLSDVVPADTSDLAERVRRWRARCVAAA